MADFAPDLSSYPKPNLQNPLDQAQKTTDLMGQFAVGQGIQQAIQPDGTIDRNILAQVLKGSIAGSMQAPQALTALERLRQAGYGADKEGIEAIRSHMALSSALMAPLANKKNEDGSDAGVSQEELIKGWGKIIAHDVAHAMPSAVPVAAKSLQETYSMTPQQRQQWVKDRYLQGQSNQQQFEAGLPRTPPFNSGAASGEVIAGTRLNPQGFSVPTAPPPTQPTIDLRPKLPNGQPNPNYRRPTIIGEQPSTAPNIMRFDANGQPIQPDITKRIVGYQGQPTSGGQPVRLAQPGDGTRLGVPSPTANLPTGLGPGEIPPLEQSGKNLAAELNEASTYAARMNPLRQAIPLAEKVGASGTGPGQETVQHIKAFAQTFGLPTFNQNTIKSYAELKKYLSQNAAAVAPPGTNIPSVLNAFEANPNVQQPQQAIVDLSKMLYGLGRMRQASVLEFKKTGEPAGEYNDWASKWSPQQDVRGYISDLMTPKERAALAKSVGDDKATLRKLNQSHQIAKNNDLLGDVEGHPLSQVTIRPVGQ